MEIKLSDHFNYRRLIRFTLPSIAMNLCASIYTIVDGFFVSNYAGKLPFAAINIIFPFIMILTTVGFMFGTGGSALVSKTMGEGKIKKANEIFSLLIYTSIGLGIIMAFLGYYFTPMVCAYLGATGQTLKYAIQYGHILMCCLPVYILQFEFQSFVIAAQKPNLGLIFSIIAGITNMVGDFVLVGVLKMGLVGAALATASSITIGGLLPLIYFIRPNSSILRLGKTHFEIQPIIKTMTNGISELLSNISMSLVSVLYNIQLLKYLGEDGVAAYGVVMYVCMIFYSIYVGYVMGSAPIVSYHYGANNHDELKNLYKKSICIILISSIAMLLSSELLAKPLSMIYVSYDEGLLELTVHAMKVYGLVYLFAGFNIFASSFFTALNDGLTSGIISSIRTLVFQLICIMVLPLLIDTEGIWISSVVAEALSIAVAFYFIKTKRKIYHY